ncbi:MAG: AraC family transcriptional regulator [Bacteroidota bacterium]|nr:AraC family transcriptional regulator [Bacteroidota bacterium]
MILFKFQNIIPKTEVLSPGEQLKTIPSVLIATSNLNTEAIIPVDTNTASINIEVDANYLNGLFELKEENLSVSYVGYKLGFINLSHFSRVFNEHMGMKPKQYSRS